MWLLVIGLVLCWPIYNLLGCYKNLKGVQISILPSSQTLPSKSIWKFNSNCKFVLGHQILRNRHEFIRGSISSHPILVIFVGLCTLSFYAINMDVVSLFTYSSFLFLVNLYCIDVLYQFEWMNVVCFVSKKKNIMS